MHTPFKNNEIQNTYFVAENMDDLWNCLPAVDAYLEKVYNSEIDINKFKLNEQVGSMMD